MNEFKTIKGVNGDLAYQYVRGTADLPPIIFLTGFKSDMMGGKAQFLHDLCISENRSFLRFDYFGHGSSGGNFMDFTIGHAVDDAIFMLDHCIKPPAIVIGSSMGGWIGLRLLEMIPDQVYGFIGIAAAPDFTSEIKLSMNDKKKTDLMEKGFFEEESGYDEPYVFTQTLLDNGDVHSMLNRSIVTDKPVTLLNGKQDPVVPWQKAEGINKMIGGHAKIHYIDDGDHSLSRPQDLQLLKAAIDEMTS